MPIKRGSPTVAMPGYQVDIVDEGCHPVKTGEMGSIVIKLPLPPGCLPTLYRNDERMRESYLKEFPGYYKTADAGVKDADGYLTILGRTDDIINVAGHRLSTGGMEEVVAAHPDVAECAVLGVKDEIKGEQPCGFVVLKAGVDRPHAEIEKEVVALVRDKIGPVAAFKLALVVQRLPKTRSGKILARHDEEDRRSRPLGDAGDHRRSRRARRGRRRAQGPRPVGARASVGGDEFRHRPGDGRLDGVALRPVGLSRHQRIEDIAERTVEARAALAPVFVVVGKFRLVGEPGQHMARVGDGVDLLDVSRRGERADRQQNRVLGPQPVHLARRVDHVALECA